MGSVVKILSQHWGMMDPNLQKKRLKITKTVPNLGVHPLVSMPMGGGGRMRLISRTIIHPSYCNFDFTFCLLKTH